MREQLLPGLQNMMASTNQAYHKLRSLEIWLQKICPADTSLHIDLAADAILINRSGSTAIIATRYELENGTDWKQFKDRIEVFLGLAEPPPIPMVSPDFSLSELEQAADLIRELECKPS